jgi:hypothetical protein
MQTFGLITLYAVCVMVGLTLLATAFVFLGKFFTDIAEDPDAEAH